MEKSIEEITSYFRNETSRILFLITEDFERSVQKIDRLRDENVFQQLQSRYTKELKNRLSASAENLIDKYSNHINPDFLRREFSNHISYNITSFQLKIRSM